jgi:NAD(P)-dependent dehydrogenase (short-subunit alcohol dehydrogenase family)
VLRFSSEGWRIITCSRDEVPAACKRDPNWAQHITADLALPEEVEGFIAEASDILGTDPLHALVNNAAVSPKTPFKERLGCLNGDVAQWREVFEINFFTPLVLGRGFSISSRRWSSAVDLPRRCGAAPGASSTLPPSPGTSFTPLPAPPIRPPRRRFRP